MNHYDFQLFTILLYLEKLESKNGMNMKLFLLTIRTNTELLDCEKIGLETFVNCWLLTHIIAVVIVMINHISYELNLPNIVSITWCMSLPELEGR